MNNLTSSPASSSASLLESQLRRPERVAFCVVAALESVLIVLGNSLIVALFLRHKALRKPKFYLLINLAVADLLVGAATVPVWVSSFARHRSLWNYDNSKLCAIPAYSSLAHLMMIPLHNMHRIYCPQRWGIPGKSKHRVMIALGWLLSFVVPCFVGIHHAGLIPQRTYIPLLTSYKLCLQLIICMSYFAIWIRIKVWQRSRPDAACVRNRKFTVSILILIGVALVTGTPHSLVVARLVISNSRSVHSSGFIRIVSTTMILAFFNSLANPIIYTLRLPQVRRAITSYIPKCFREDEYSITNE